MLGYDALPMTEPSNYRFVPGRTSQVSEYFRLLAKADAVVCISDYSRESILDRLRRDRALTTNVAHPGGDHVKIKAPRARTSGEPITFVRLGTLEERKRPLEILAAFKAVRALGVDAEITFIGSPSASNESINESLRTAVAQGIGVTWVRGADDAQVQNIISDADVFLSIGVEGYGIPVLEAIRLGTPVAYHGIQPAAEIMEGRGATRVPGESIDELTQSMIHLAESPPRNVEPEAVPTWSKFVKSVVEAASE
jgi:glycosyltransferase involved in cell wall biosynthesis